MPPKSTASVLQNTGKPLMCLRRIRRGFAAKCWRPLQKTELHRLLGKKTLEAEILKEALKHATGSKRMARPVCKGFVQGSLTQSASTYPACGKTPAKMEIRASQSS